MKDTIHDNIVCPKRETLFHTYRYSLNYTSTNTRKPVGKVEIVIESSAELSPGSLFNLSSVALRLSNFHLDPSDCKFSGE
jgi:hypothetical protein